MSYSLKLIDFKTNSYETTFGTCDLCMGTGMHTEEIFVFELPGGKIIEMENGFWDWGDYFDLVSIQNTADFAHWLSGEEFEGDPPADEYEMQNIIRDIEDKYDAYLMYQKHVVERGLHVYGVDGHIEFSIGDDYSESLNEKEMDAEFMDAIMSVDGVNKHEIYGECDPSGRTHINERYGNMDFTLFYLAAVDESSLIKVIEKVFDLCKKYEKIPGVSFDHFGFYFFLDGDSKKIEIEKDAFDKHEGNGDYPKFKISPSA